MGRRSQQDADELHRRFMENYDHGDDRANDQVVRDADPRDPVIVDGEVRR